MVKQGTPSESNLNPPELERNEQFYELALARVYVGPGVTSVTDADITDDRGNVDLCGKAIPYAVDGLGQDLTKHLAETTSHVRYGVATGSANAYAVTLNPAPTAYVDGMALSVKINVDNTGASNINVNGLGAKSIKKSNGNDVSAGNLKTGSVYTLRYNGTNFILQGEGGSGNAQPDDVLSGKTFTNDQGEQTGTLSLTGDAADANVLSGKTYYNTDAKTRRTGTMPNNGAIASTITTQGGQYTVPAGYHNGTGKVTADFANLIAANVRQGVNIGGVVGTLVEGKKFASGTATSGGSLTNMGGGNFWPLTVSGLNFIPSLIFIRTTSGTPSFTLYSNINAISSPVYLRRGDGSDFNLNLSGNQFVNSTGFSLAADSGHREYSWIAYE